MLIDKREILTGYASPLVKYFYLVVNLRSSRHLLKNAEILFGNNNSAQKILLRHAIFINNTGGNIRSL